MATVKRKDFLAMLQRLKPALGASNSSIEELKHFWFGRERAAAFNGGLGIETKFALDWEGGIPGPPLLALLSSEVSEDVELVSPAAGKLDLKFGKTKVSLVTRPIENSPWAYDEGEDDRVAEQKLTEALMGALKRVAIMRTSAPVAVEHYGVSFFPDKKSLMLYTTNSRVIVEVICGVPNSAAKQLDRAVLTFELLSILLSEAAPGDVLQLYPNRWKLKTKDLVVYSNVLDTSGVRDVPEIVGNQLDAVTETIELPNGLKAALERVDILAGSKPAVITIVIEGRSLKLEGKLMYGDFSEELPIKGSRTKNSLQIDGRLLSLGIGEAKSLAFAKAALVLEDGGDFKFLLARHN